MFFIHPMWDNESQRVGMLKCWKAAYYLHGYGELVGFLGLLTLFGTIAYMLYIAIFADFSHSTWWLLCVPLGMGVLSELMVFVSWFMVGRRGFAYDYDTRTASWVENGQTVTYRYVHPGTATDGTSRDQ